MPSPGTYNFIIHPTDGSVEHTTNATLILECCNYAYAIVHEPNCCGGYICDAALEFGGLPCDPLYFEIPWSVDYYDSCDNLMSTENGVLRVGYNCSHPGDCQAAYMVFSGDTAYTDPNGGVNSILVYVDNCGCA